LNIKVNALKHLKQNPQYKSTQNIKGHFKSKIESANQQNTIQTKPNTPEEGEE